MAFQWLSNGFPMAFQWLSNGFRMMQLRPFSKIKVSGSQILRLEALLRHLIHLQRDCAASGKFKDPGGGSNDLIISSFRARAARYVNHQHVADDAESCQTLGRNQIFMFSFRHCHEKRGGCTLLQTAPLCSSQIRAWSGWVADAIQRL